MNKCKKNEPFEEEALFRVEATLESGERDEQAFSNNAVLDDELGEAQIENLPLENGGNIALTLFLPKADMELKLDTEEGNPLVNFVVLLDGEATMSFPGSATFQFTPNRGGVFRYIGDAATFNLKGGQLVRSVGVSLPPDVLSRYLDHCVPKALHSQVTVTGPGNNFTPFSVSSGMRTALAHLIAPGLSGKLRELQTESAALQYITMVSRVMYTEQEMPSNTITDKDRATAQRARELLCANLSNPPSLRELSALVEMNEKRLNAVFRDLFNATVFEVLREERFNQAKIALANDDVPLKEIAYRVGYAHVSNFVNAFTRHFGVPPRQYQKDSTLT